MYVCVCVCGEDVFEYVNTHGDWVDDCNLVRPLWKKSITENESEVPDIR